MNLLSWHQMSMRTLLEVENKLRSIYMSSKVLTLGTIIQIILLCFESSTFVQDYKIYTYFYQRWKDERLAGKLNHTLIIKGGDINMWLPDPYCYNARESNMMTPDEELHSSVSIQPSGDIIYSKG